ncbi:NAD(P)-binding protein [Marasmius fiardii PR-910]|nr:NAD(P)-binding protein [Marasmius fiardii PR-910]
MIVIHVSRECQTTTNRVILVTGSNSGIGYEIVKGLAKKGHTAYLAARKEAAGKEAQAKLKKDHNMDVKFVLLNVEDPNSIVAARDVIDNAEGRLDVLVNSASISGIGQPQTTCEMDMSVIQSALETNVFGLIQTTTAFIPLLRKAKPRYGNIVQVTMEWPCGWYQTGEHTDTTFAGYCASRAAANLYSIALARDLKKDNIKVNAACPGFVTTKLNLNAPGGKTPEEGAKVIVDLSLLGKIANDSGKIPW